MPQAVRNRARNSANVAGLAPSSEIANATNWSRRSKNASSSRSVRLYGLPPTMASLEWNSRLSSGTPSEASRLARLLHLVERRVRGAKPEHPRDSELPQDPLRRVRPGRPRVPVPQPRGIPAIERRRDRELQEAAAARAARVVVRQEVRLERSLDEIRAALVRLVEQRGDAGLDQVARAFERRHVGRPRTRTGPTGTRPAARRPPPRLPR